MHTTFQNLSPNIVLLSDLNIKFYPKGKLGDALNLIEHVSLDAIKNSLDLQKFLSCKILAPIAPKKEPDLRNQKGINVTSKYYIRRKSQPKMKDPNTGKMVVVYDHANKRCLSPGAAAPQRRDSSVHKKDPNAGKMTMVYNPNTRQCLSPGTLNRAPVVQLPGEMVSPTPTVIVAKSELEKPYVVFNPNNTIAATLEPLTNTLECNASVEPLTNTLECDASVEPLTSTLEYHAEPETNQQPVVDLDPALCGHMRSNGKQCRGKKVTNSQFCRLHNPID